MIGRSYLYAANMRQVKAYDSKGVLRNKEEMLWSSLTTSHPKEIQRRWQTRGGLMDEQGIPDDMQHRGLQR